MYRNKLIVKVNGEETEETTKQKNTRKFEIELSKYKAIKHENLKQTETNKRKRADSSLEESDPRPKTSKTITNDEESSDSFKSVEDYSSEKQNLTNKQIVDKQTMIELKQENAELKKENAELKQELLNIKKRELEVESALFLCRIQKEMLERDKETLLKEREETAELACRIINVVNKKEDPLKQ
ncbi:unnamed protein product [Brachionus calyciflorus]|uniref:Uncharacterized protein n=1 Tax=Brachionus calyciflorus TaxID=104777 RepID=A0A813ZC52_9BILA|nr:unnamed protein product [Brachionus calyciflorus]